MRGSDSTTTSKEVAGMAEEVVRERLAEHRSVLETLARTDHDLAEDARRALEILDESDGGQS